MKRNPSQKIRFGVKSLVAAAAVWTFIAAPEAHGQASAQANSFPPGQISYQGFLTDANGVALATNAPKNYNVTFRVYDGANSTNVLWAELQTVTAYHGYFSVLLGQGSAVSGAF